MADMIRKKSKMKKEKQTTPEKIAFYIYCTIVFLLIPVLFVRNMIDGVQPVRLLVLAVSLLIVSFLLLLSPKNTFPVKLWKNPLILLSGLLLLITVISIFFAINRQEAYFDIAKTMLFFVFMLVTILIFYANKNWPEMTSRFIVVSSFVALGVGFYQYFVDVLLIDEKFLPDGRSVIYNVTGLMAHKNQYAINLMLMLPFVIFGILVFKNFWRWAAVAALVLVITMIVIIHTRSVWIAIILAGLTMISFAGWNYRFMNIGRRTRNIVVISAFAAVFAGVAIIAVFPAKNEFTRLGQLKSIANPDAGNNAFRLNIWKLTTQMISDRPLTGVGAGNWKIRAGEYFHQFAFEGHELNWLRPHNDILWVTAEKGMIGLIVYLALFIFTVIFLAKAFFRQNDTTGKWMVLFIMAGFLGYHFTSLFSFPSERINQQIFLWLFTSIAIVLNVRERKENTTFLSRGLMAMLPAMLIFPLLYGNALINSDRAMIRARTELQRSNWTRLLNEMKNVENWSRNMDSEAMPFAWYRGRAHSGLGNSRKALENYLEALDAHPSKVTILHNIGIIYSRMGNNQLAYKYFDDVLKIVPTYKITLEAKASIFVQDNLIREAFETLKLIPQKQRTQKIKNNLTAIRRMLVKQLVDDAIDRRNAGEDFDVDSIVRNAGDIFYDLNNFGEYFNEMYQNTLDEQMRLEVLLRIPPAKRSDETKTIIQSLTTKNR
jgi:O-antigen ligase